MPWQNIKISSLKGVCHEIFDPFFHDSNPSGPLINSLKYFRIRFRFRQDIWSQSDLRGVQHTAEMISMHTTETISAVCNTPQRQYRWCATYRRDKLHTAETKKYKMLINKKHFLSQRCAAHRGDHFVCSNISAKSKPNSKIL